MHDLQALWNEIAGPIPMAGELEAREDTADNMASDLSEIVSPTKIVAKTGDCLQLIVHHLAALCRRNSKSYLEQAATAISESVPYFSCNA